MRESEVLLLPSDEPRQPPTGSCRASRPHDDPTMRGMRSTFVLGVAALAVSVAASLAVAAAPGPPRYGAPRLVVTTDIADHGSPRIEQSADFNGDGYVASS